MKKGDKVVCVDPYSSSPNLVIKGQVYTINKEPDVQGNCYIYLDGVGTSVLSSRFKLVEQPVFKVGDRVRCIKEYHTLGGINYLVGGCHVIKELSVITNNYMTFEEYPEPQYAALKENFELITETPEPEVRKPAKIIYRIPRLILLEDED